MARFDIEAMDAGVLGFGLEEREVAVEEGLSVGRPVEIHHSFIQDRRGNTPEGGHRIVSVRRSGASAVEDDLPAVWRPVGKHRPHWRKCQLEAIRSVWFAAPKGAFGICHVGDPFAVRGELEEVEGFATEVRQELVLLRVVSDQFSAKLLPERVHGCARRG